MVWASHIEKTLNFRMKLNQKTRQGISIISSENFSKTKSKNFQKIQFILLEILQPPGQ